MKINFKTLTQKVVPMLVRSIYKILENLYNICYIKLYTPYLTSITSKHLVLMQFQIKQGNIIEHKYLIFMLVATVHFWCIQKILEWRLYRKISPRSNMSRFNSHTINQIIEMVALQIVISFPVMKTNFILINIEIGNNTLIIIRRLIGPIHLLAVIRYHNVNMNSRKYSSTISMMHQWSLVVSRSSTISSS